VTVGSTSDNVRTPTRRGSDGSKSQRGKEKAAA
jgi:hypothetical protein